MKLFQKAVGSWIIYEVDGTVDSVHTKAFNEGISKASRGGHSHIIVDITQSPFLSIAAIRHLNQISQLIESKGGRFAILGANERIRRHIDIFVSWKKIREINSIWEIIPLQMVEQFRQMQSVLVVESIVEPPPDLLKQNLC